ncbi:MAG: hypothetical protein P8H57_13285 [Emcibacteraceae bacterium]|nr:hypothetical protein [Emcibacteraceae bacterium]
MSDIIMYKKFFVTCLITLNTTVIFISNNVQASAVLDLKNAYEVCNTADMDWINFCNGLIQGYADVATITKKACIPEGTTRTTLVTLFTSSDILKTEAYQKNDSALLGALEIFGKYYPCR